MRSLALIAGLVMSLPMLAADTKDEALATRVRVALALTATAEKPCHYTDFSAGSKDALASGKVLLVFVATPCNGRCDSGSVVSEVGSYGMINPERPRLIVLSRGGPGEDRDTLYIRSELADDAPPDVIEKAVQGAMEKSGDDLNWFGVAPRYYDLGIVMAVGQGATCTGPNCSPAQPNLLPPQQMAANPTPAWVPVRQRIKTNYAPAAGATAATRVRPLFQRGIFHPFRATAGFLMRR